MTSTESKWAERVREWRAGGKSAEEFAAPFEFKASTLRFWASRLKSGADKTAPVIAQVVRERPRASTSEAALSPTHEVEVVIGSARIVVRRGFDVELLRQVAAALGSAR
jgi:hypothetical protein